jgi:hypothetical protein
VLKNLQHGLGFLIGFFAMLIAAIGVIVGIESLTGTPLPYKTLIVLVPSLGVGVVVARWVGGIDLSKMFPAKPATPPAAAPPRPKRKRRPWSFHLIWTLTVFWFLSLVAIIILFGPFGFQDNYSVPVQLMKITACTVLIAGLGVFLLRKELLKLMSGPVK